MKCGTEVFDKFVWKPKEELENLPGSEGVRGNYRSQEVHGLAFTYFIEGRGRSRHTFKLVGLSGQLAVK
jgi:hypothetical protein